MVLLSEIDPYQHQRVEQGKNFNMNNYHPRYWLINGRGFPDSIADNGAAWLPTQPYGALAQIHEFDTSTPPLPGMARYLNVGTEDYPFHPHGNNGLVIGRDGNPLEGASGRGPVVREVRHQHRARTDLGRDLQVVRRRGLRPVGNPVPVTVPSLANSVIGTFYSGSPYLGHQGDPADRNAHAQPVRRVLHHLAQPRAVPDHLLGSQHDRAHHLHADRSARTQQLRLREAVTTMKRTRMTRRASALVLSTAGLTVAGLLFGPASAGRGGDGRDRPLRSDREHDASRWPDGHRVGLLHPAPGCTDSRLQRGRDGGDGARRARDRGQRG